MTDMNLGTRITPFAFAVSVVLKTDLRCRWKHEHLELKICKPIKIDLGQQSPVSLVVEAVIQLTCHSPTAGISHVISANMQICTVVVITLSIEAVIQAKTCVCRESMDYGNLPLLVFCDQNAAFCSFSNQVSALVDPWGNRSVRSEISEKAAEEP